MLYFGFSEFFYYYLITGFIFYLYIFLVSIFGFIIFNLIYAAFYKHKIRISLTVKYESLTAVLYYILWPLSKILK